MVRTMLKTLLFSALIFFTNSLFAQIPVPLVPGQYKNVPSEKSVHKAGSGLIIPLEKGKIFPADLDANDPIGNFAKKPGRPQPLVQRTISKDARGLILNQKGNLLSVQGYEVEFRVPDNPNDPGICSTPVPYVILPDGATRANCPPAVPCDNAVNRDANIPVPTDPIKYMQLNWTIVENGANSNINQTRVDQLMAELNADFLPFRIQFCADPATFVTDATFYTLNVGTEDAGLKTTYGVNPGNQINVYVVGSITNPSAGGYARFPYDPFGGLNIRGGVVMSRSNSFLGTHTLAHELGHTFGLHHTFHGVDEVAACTNCYEGRDLASGASSTADTEGDWCSDTNPHPTNANICGDNGTDGCAPGLPWLNSPVDNHMSYSFCTNTFTPQQAGRMHCMIDTYLSNWVAFGGATCAAQPPVADFAGTPTFWLAPLTANFIDNSLPASVIDSAVWNFDLTGIGGVTPATFSDNPYTQTPPQVTFAVADTCYTVRLIVYSANGNDTLTRTDYICTAAPPTAGACDTIDHTETPPNVGANSGLFAWAYGANDYITGIPNADGYIGFYERYFTTGTNNVIGEIYMALANAVNASGNLACRIRVYPNDPLNTGFPDLGNPIGGTIDFAPDTVGVPGSGSFVWLPVQFCNPIQLGTTNDFFIGLEVTGGNFATDSLVLLGTYGPTALAAPYFGQGLGLNVQVCPFCPNPFPGTWNNYLTNVWGVPMDFDLGIVPVLGEIAPVPFISAYGEQYVCDTTLSIFVDSFLCSTPSSWEFEFSDGVIINDTSYAAIDTFGILYTTPGPVNLTIRTANDCGRIDSNSYIINYALFESPTVDFTKNLANPICAGTPVTFTANPASLDSLVWDFGDGNTQTVTGSNTVSHTYTAPGTYYVNLVGYDSVGCSGTEQKLDYVVIIDCSVNAPLAGFEQTPDSGCVPLLVSFTDTSQAVPDPATSWFWDFGDGNFSIAQNPNHTYAVAGTYTVMFISTNMGGSDTAFYSIRILPLPCTLPIDVGLKGNLLDGKGVLSWETYGAGVELATFFVEKSLDNLNFGEIGRVDGSNSRDGGLYSFVDNSLNNGEVVFYRIRTVEATGEISYSNIVELTVSGASRDWLDVYPNPVSRNSILNVDAFLSTDTQISMELYDLPGKLIQSESKKMEAGMQRFELNTTELPAGTYFVKVSTPFGNEVRRVVIE